MLKVRRYDAAQDSYDFDTVYPHPSDEQDSLQSTGRQ
jgi:hypothetical protein